MKVLTYVNSILTVINKERVYIGVLEKPNFIPGLNFYFEPTLKEMDGQVLSQELMNKANEFIDNFNFDLYANIDKKLNDEMPIKHYVDKFGNYVGNDNEDNDLFEVPYLLEKDEKWDFSNNKKFKYAIVDLNSLKITDNTITINENNTANYIYVDLNLLDKDVCGNCQVYNLETKKFDIVLSDLKNKKIASLSLQCLDEIKKQGGDLGNGANAVHNSWLRQELEAEAWIKDNSVNTPFIDNIIIGRGLEEDKEAFVNKILEKANNYKITYGKNLGKLSAKIKAIEIATSKEEILNINW